jgi:hypothetical protein
VYIYFNKSENREVYELLGTVKDRIPMKIETIEMESRFNSHSPQYLAEGMSWEVLK